MATADRETSDQELTNRDSSSSPRTPALPNARLNPLLNPLLAKQLGRWAHIYYTASAENREAAVEKLVCELEAEAARMDQGEGATAEHPVSAPVANSGIGPVLVAPVPRPEAETQVHVESAVAEPVFSEPAFVEAEVVEIGGDGRMSVEPPMVESFHSHQAEDLHSRADSRVVEFAEALTATTPKAEPLAFGAPVSVPSPKEPSPWERFRPLETEGTDRRNPELFSSSKPVQASWWRPVVAIGLAAIAGVSLWLVYQRSNRPRVVPVASSRVSVPPTSAPPVSAVNAAKATPQSATTSPVLGATAHTTLAVGAPAPALPKATPNPATGTPIPDENAADPDLRAALRFLQGPLAQRNSTEAVPHLWQAVKRQNGTALLTLAELFARGDGVSKDCDQAKILFGAAERQAKPDSQIQRITATRAVLQTSGCE